jgi:hypothetical protein
MVPYPRRHGFHAAVVLQGIEALLTAEARLLGPAERRMDAAGRVFVDENLPRLDVMRKTVGVFIYSASLTA